MVLRTLAEASRRKVRAAYDVSEDTYLRTVSLRERARAREGGSEVRF